jgi:hypothetical protein
MAPTRYRKLTVIRRARGPLSIAFAYHNYAFTILV